MTEVTTQLVPLQESLLFPNATGFGPRPAICLSLSIGQFCLLGVVLLLSFLVEKSRTPPNTSSCTYTHVPVVMFRTVTKVPSFPLWAEGPATEEFRPFLKPGVAGPPLPSFGAGACPEPSGPQLCPSRRDLDISYPKG